MVKKQYKDFTNYFIYSDGRIFSKKNNIFLKPIDNGNGYKCITLCNNGKYYRQYIHRIVAETFIENHLNKLKVNHKNGIKSDNRVENLEWVTDSENMQHASKNGLLNIYIRYGEKNPNYKHGMKAIFNIEKICPVCNKTFITKTKRSVCCSRSCNCNYFMNKLSYTKEEMKNIR